MTTHPRVPYLDHPGPLAFAHRGWSRDGLENSMAAFAAAVDLGYRYVETDVRTTADGVCVAFHDDRLDRATDGQGRVADLPWSRVRTARIGGLEPVPRLDDVLAAWPELRLNVDVKSAAVVAPFARAVDAAAAHDRVLVASFSDRRRRAVQRLVRHRLAASAGTGVAVALTAACAARAPVAAVRVVLRGVDAVQLPPRHAGVPVVTPPLVHRVHAAGRQVHAWTVDDAAEMHRLLDLGVDGIVTDRADTLRDVLRARGAWPR